MSKSVLDMPPGMPAAEVIAALRKKGVSALHHANTVRTSLGFLRAGAMLSRRQGELRDIGQTWQRTDEMDKKLGIWDMLFLDPVDNHSQYGHANRYGPVLFVFKASALADPAVVAIRATKGNPLHWKEGDTAEERWCMDVDDFRTTFDGRSGSNSIVLTCRDGALPFLPNLEVVRLDTTKRGMPETGEDIFSTVRGAYQQHLQGFDLCGRIAEYCSGCYCASDYRRMSTRDYNRMFAL